MQIKYYKPYGFLLPIGFISRFSCWHIKPFTAWHQFICPNCYRYIRPVCLWGRANRVYWLSPAPDSEPKGIELLSLWLLNGGMLFLRILDLRPLWTFLKDCWKRICFGRRLQIDLIYSFLIVLYFLYPLYCILLYCIFVCFVTVLLNLLLYSSASFVCPV